MTNYRKKLIEVSLPLEAIDKASANTYRSQPKLSTLVTELSWSHHLAIMSRCKRDEEREFYLRLATRERWSFRELERQLPGALFERVVLLPPKLSTLVTELHPGAAEVFKDAYLMEFLDLAPRHSETDLQRGLVEQLKLFLIELGRDFCYVGSHYLIQVGGRDFALDLLFFNRALNSLNLRFSAAPKGPKQESPGQRPGDPVRMRIRPALKGRNEILDQDLFCPFRALLFTTPDSIPRAAPWAGMSLPLRGEIQEARLQYLNSLVAFELKVVEFEPEHLGKLQFYLEALDRDVKKPHEEPSIGVLLCATKNQEVVEYALSRAMSPALVAEYQTRLPDKKLLQAKLHEFYELARQNAPLTDPRTEAKTKKRK